MWSAIEAVSTLGLQTMLRVMPVSAISTNAPPIHLISSVMRWRQPVSARCRWWIWSGCRCRPNCYTVWVGCTGRIGTDGRCPISRPARRRHRGRPGAHSGSGN